MSLPRMVLSGLKGRKKRGCQPWNPILKVLPSSATSSLSEVLQRSGRRQWRDSDAGGGPPARDPGPGGPAPSQPGPRPSSQIYSRSPHPRRWANGRPVASVLRRVRRRTGKVPRLQRWQRGARRPPWFETRGAPRGTGASRAGLL